MNGKDSQREKIAYAIIIHRGGKVKGMHRESQRMWLMEKRA